VSGWGGVACADQVHRLTAFYRMLRHHTAVRRFRWSPTVSHVTVDYQSPIPPHRQVAEIIRARIRSGELAPGDRVPGVTGLMQEFGIARTTAGKVLAALRDEGLITVVPGWGSFVKE